MNFTVSQTLENGIVVNVKTDSPFYTQTVIIETNRQLADGDKVPNMCVISDGIISPSEDTVGLPSKIHAFKEVSCSDYQCRDKPPDLSLEVEPAPQTKQVPLQTAQQQLPQQPAPEELPTPTRTRVNNWHEVFVNNAGKLYIDPESIVRGQADTMFESRLVSPTGDKTTEDHQVNCQENKFDGNDIHPNTPADAVYKYLCTGN